MVIVQQSGSCSCFLILGIHSVPGSMLGTKDTKTRGEENVLSGISCSRFLKQNFYEEIIE